MPGSNCCGMIEWEAVREAASRFILKHTAAAAWKHRNLSHVEKEGLPPMPKDRGAEQGDVDGPLECSLAGGMVAAETRQREAAQQPAGSLPWIDVDDPSAERRLQAGRNQPTSSLAAPKSLLVPTTRSMRCRKTEAWQTRGTWMTVTLSLWCAA